MYANIFAKSFSSIEEITTIASGSTRDIQQYTQLLAVII